MVYWEHIGVHSTSVHDVILLYECAQNELSPKNLLFAQISIFYDETGEIAWFICGSKYIFYNVSQDSHEIMQYISWKTQIYVKDWHGVHVIPQ